jgi:hypothetical protein
MRSLALTALLVGVLFGSAQARNLAQEVYDKEVEKLNPLSTGHIQPDDGLNLKSSPEFSAGEEQEGDALTQEPGTIIPSLQEYLTGFQEQQTYTDDELFLINSAETMEGKKLQLNPEVLKKIKIPEEKKKTSWWDDVVEIFGEMFT